MPSFWTGIVWWNFLEDENVLLSCRPSCSRQPLVAPGCFSRVAYVTEKLTSQLNFYIICCLEQQNSRPCVIIYCPGALGL